MTEKNYLSDSITLTIQYLNFTFGVLWIVFSLAVALILQDFVPFFKLIVFWLIFWSPFSYLHFKLKEITLSQGFVIVRRIFKTIEIKKIDVVTIDSTFIPILFKLKIRDGRVFWFLSPLSKIFTFWFESREDALSEMILKVRE